MFIFFPYYPIDVIDDLVVFYCFIPGVNELFFLFLTSVVYRDFIDIFKGCSFVIAIFPLLSLSSIIELFLLFLFLLAHWVYFAHLLSSFLK